MGCYDRILRIQQWQRVLQWNLLMAGALLSLLPAAVLFFIAQRHLTSGISLSSAMKG